VHLFERALAGRTRPPWPADKGTNGASKKSHRNAGQVRRVSRVCGNTILWEGVTPLRRNRIQDFQDDGFLQEPRCCQIKVLEIDEDAK